jgi:hypothetical protein
LTLAAMATAVAMDASDDSRWMILASLFHQMRLIGYSFLSALLRELKKYVKYTQAVCGTAGMPAQTYWISLYFSSIEFSSSV